MGVVQRLSGGRRSTDSRQVETGRIGRPSVASKAETMEEVGVQRGVAAWIHHGDN